MKERNTLEKFSTFIQYYEPNSFLTPSRWVWVSDPELQRNMQKMIDSEPDANQEFWFQYWLQLVKKDSSHLLANRHLSAYLEEVCYWTAIRIYKKLAYSGFDYIDYFQIARELATKPAVIFKNYDASRSHFMTYGQRRLENLVMERLNAQIQVSRVDKYSDWGLLRSLSKKILQQALRQWGIGEPQLSHYLLAWRCFNEIYTPTQVSDISRSLAPPNLQQLAAMANYYNELLFSSHSKEEIDNQDILMKLKTCIKAVRSSFNIQVESLDSNDFIQDYITDIMWEGEEFEEDEQNQVRLILSKAFMSLSSDVEKKLILYYGLGLTQLELGRILGIKQYQVSRLLNREKYRILNALINWSKETFDLQISSEKIINLANHLDEWLGWYCQKQLQKILQENLLQERGTETALLRFYYGHNLSQNQVAKKMNNPELEVNEKLTKVKQTLQAQLQDWLQNWTGLSPKSISLAERQIIDFVETWLNNAPSAQFIGKKKEK